MQSENPQSFGVWVGNPKCSYSRDTRSVVSTAVQHKHIKPFSSGSVCLAHITRRSVACGTGRFCVCCLFPFTFSGHKLVLSHGDHDTFQNPGSGSARAGMSSPPIESSDVHCCSWRLLQVIWVCYGINGLGLTVFHPVHNGAAGGITLLISIVCEITVYH